MQVPRASVGLRQARLTWVSILSRTDRSRIDP
jgi:hypothetical protein